MQYAGLSVLCNICRGAGQFLDHHWWMLYDQQGYVAEHCLIYDFFGNRWSTVPKSMNIMTERGSHCSAALLRDDGGSEDEMNSNAAVVVIVVVAGGRDENSDIVASAELLMDVRGLLLEYAPLVYPLPPFLLGKILQFVTNGNSNDAGEEDGCCIENNDKALQRVQKKPRAV
mmetsp:Transcript_20356/g.30361  ORF Transcript_20356/g.30361 Transcript_20356/m.30361 type:complete len:172 (-) Transcript_20356:268-783(-)